MVLVLCALGVAASACGVLKAPAALPTATATHANLLADPGFESGADGWTPVPPNGPAVAITAKTAHGGSKSLSLDLAGDAAAGTGRTTGAAQALTGTVFPEMLSGFYRAGAWRPRAASQNVRFVVTVRGGDFGDGLAVHQVRFIIAGSDVAAKLLPGVVQVYLSRAAPPVGRWTYFGYPVRQAFIDKFGKAPAAWDGIDVSVEVGYDLLEAGAQGEVAQVQFDDLYAGPLAENPNRPPNP